MTLEEPKKQIADDESEMMEFLKKENKTNTTAQTQMKQRRRGRG